MVPSSNSSISLTAAAGQARHAGDAVADLGDTANGLGLERRLEAFEILLSAEAMSAALMVSSAIVRISLQSIDLSWSRRVRTLPSMIWSPTWATIHRARWDRRCPSVRLIAGGVGQRGCQAGLLLVGERNGRANLGNGLGLRTCGALTPSLVMIAGRSRPRPEPTTKLMSCVVVALALPPSRSSTIGLALSGRDSSSVSVFRSASEPRAPGRSGRARLRPRRCDPRPRRRRTARWRKRRCGRSQHS